MPILHPIHHNPKLNDWLVGQGASPELRQTVLAMAAATAAIAGEIRQLALEGTAGLESGITNVQGETQLKLDDVCNQLCLDLLQQVPVVRYLVSEEIDHVITNINAPGEHDYAVCFDPLDGSGNIATNNTIGTVFSVLDCTSAKGDAEQRVLSSTRNQLAAGYALYGPATLLVLTTGKSVAKFALNEMTRLFELVRDDIRIAPDAAEFSINMSYASFWPRPVRAYVRNCVAGASGPRGKAFNMRWAGAMVADMHRVFIKGGHFIYPAMPKKGEPDGKLRLLYEGIPMAMLAEAAGGAAMAGGERLRDVVPTSIHQRTPVSLGARNEVNLLAGMPDVVKAA
ncbi:MAG: fructose-1,6-bisphosphatase [Hyphomicrobiaceae bacterium]|nr:fructose-1,6-bisphosphatase [Hyphomicrobiaceae bacterium]MCC0025231.1 fructose-1,6-bisphosphatase [Hyphomicrobiaceae bacterium]